MFDHFKAWSCSFTAFLLVGTLAFFASLMAPPTWTSSTLAAGGAICLGSYVFSRGYRVTVQVKGAMVIVVQSWLGFRYRTLAFERSSVRTMVSGTGDWGFPGSWPIAELCELAGTADGRTRQIFLGPADAREEVKTELEALLLAQPGA
jgi:hypothetical protein